MSNRRTLTATLMATTLLATGIAVAANQDQKGQTDGSSAKLTQTEQDFGKLSADGARAYQDMALARVAIFQGHTDQAKKFVSDADSALGKAKADDQAFVKADMALTKPAQPSPAKPGTDAANSASQVWLPVDAVISLDEDYTANNNKKKAVADANENLHKGDRKAAIEKLKLADVGMTVVQAVVPLEQTIKDVHQASTLINEGKFYEGSQELRKVQASARYNIASYVAGSGGKATYSHMSDAKPQNAGQQASGQKTADAPAANGPEPYSAPDPQYKPMTTEPVLQPNKPTTAPSTSGQ